MKINFYTGINPMGQDVSIFLKNIEFKNGTKIDLVDNSIVVFVGPNNSGKSLSLKEIIYLCSNKEGDTRSISKIDLFKNGSPDNLLESLSGFTRGDERYYYLEEREYGFKSRDDILKYWSDGEGLGSLTPIFINYLSTDIRLSDSNPVENFDALKSRDGTHPIHGLYLDSDKEYEMSNIFRNYFNTDLIVHRSAGNKIPLYVGDRPELSGSETATSRTYTDKIAKLEKLKDQGDGIRSFASILLRVRNSPQSIVLVDEPEAFLHPPQARAVAELIAEGAEVQKQIFIATHSNEVIQGILSKFPDRVTIVRFSRGGSFNIATYLSNENILELWKDPVLRYSNTLNGLFHDQVIVTESDGDCRFYEAVAENVKQDNISSFYIYSGGKDRIPVIVKSLVSLGVPTRSVIDMDIFSSEKTMERIIKAHNGDWVRIKSLVTGLKNVIQNRKTWLLGAGFKSRVSDILKVIRDNELVPKEQIGRIKAAMRETSPWESVKNSGLLAFPQGDPASNARNLLSILKECDVFVVPVGEIERFCATIPWHGPRWVTEVLERDLQNDPELQEARDFVGGLINFDLSSRPRKYLRKNLLSIRRVAIDTRHLNRKKLVGAFDLLYRSCKIIFFAGFGSYFIILAVELIISKFR